MKLSSLLLLASLLLAGPVFGAEEYVRQIETARAARLERLTQPYGWLTLVGQHTLPPGASTIGRAADNRIVLAAGPERFGTITWAPEEGRVLFSPVAGAGVWIDGAAAPSRAELRPGGPSRRPTMVAVGTVGFYLVESAGKKGLHVRDLAAPRLIDFPGLNYFPVDPAWCIVADWVPLEEPRVVSVANIVGEVTPTRVSGRAVFRHDGKSLALLPMENPDGSLLFVFADATSEKETYAMRFLHVARPQNGKVVLDFNLAENPPCAFSPVAVCPLPPPDNQLPFAVSAGEKISHGSAH